MNHKTIVPSQLPQALTAAISQCQRRLAEIERRVHGNPSPRRPALTPIILALPIMLLLSIQAHAGQDSAPAAAAESSEARPAGIPAPPVSADNRTAASAPVYEVNPLADYPLAPGDTLEITVWKEEGLQEQEYLIAPDGTIIFPLVGPVLAAGKTISQLKETLTSKLADFIAEPSITVKLTNNQGNSIFVIGKVNKPGQYSSGRKLDVLQALSLAGGLTVFANDRLHHHLAPRRQSNQSVSVRLRQCYPGRESRAKYPVGARRHRSRALGPGNAG